MLIAIGSMKGGVGATTLSVNLAVLLQRSGHCVALIDCHVDEPVSRWVHRRQVAGLGTVEHWQATADDPFDDSRHSYAIIDVGTCPSSTQTLLESADIWLAPTPPTPLEVDATLTLFHRWQEVRNTVSKPGLFAAVLTRIGPDERDLDWTARRKLSLAGPNLQVLNQSLNRHPAFDATYNGCGLHELPQPLAAKANAEFQAMSVQLFSAALATLLTPAEKMATA